MESLFAGGKTKAVASTNVGCATCCTRGVCFVFRACPEFWISYPGLACYDGMMAAENRQDNVLLAGVDPCRGGWVVARGMVRSENVGLCDVSVVRDFEECLERTRDCRLVCVHIPIGISDRQVRTCDAEARECLGRPRAGSVFDPPGRSVLNITDYPTAAHENLAVALRGLNMQVFYLMPRIVQVDALMSPELQDRIREVHPELAFQALNGGRAVNPGKQSARGCAIRRSLLESVLGDLKDYMPRLSLRTTAEHDVCDAIAGMWTAHRFLAGRCRVIPEESELDAKGLRMELLVPAM